MKTKKSFSITLLLMFGLFITAFSQVDGLTYYTPSTDEATAVLYPTEGNTAEGTVIFYKIKGGVRVVVDMKGLTPGKHGFHIHENGDCSAPDATSAGGHFNPGMHEHGGPMDGKRHVGDMGNITADAQGNAHLDYIDTGMTFKGEDSIIGKSIIVHQNEDDLKTQPTGNAGPRIACGVISEGGC